MITVTEIRTAEDLEAIRPEWSELWDRCPSATPFQTPEWLVSWWEAFGTGNLAALALWKERRLAGFAPFHIVGGALRLLGAGISDYLDVLVGPEFRAETAQALWAAMRRFPCRSFEFTDLPFDSVLLERVPAGAVVVPCAVCPVLELPPSKVRNVRRYRRRLGPLENASPDTLGEFLEALFLLHGARWNEVGKPGVLDDMVLKSFHRRAAAALFKTGRLLLCGVRRGGSLAAVVYGFKSRHRIWLYLSGFAPAAARLSPGTVALGLALEQAALAGCREADFLRGTEPYKYVWGARDQHTFRLEYRLLL